MNVTKNRIKTATTLFFPCLICAEFDSPIDALISLCVPLDEARDLVAASCLFGLHGELNGAPCLITQINGGRAVAALRTPHGRWAACNAFLHQAKTSQSEAERVLNTLLKRGRRGLIGVMSAENPEPACMGKEGFKVLTS